MMNTEYLYHYTSIENLALILKNRTIRLNRLDKVDDLQEQRTRDIENLGRFVFVSSWTDSINESIPMWNMYASLKAGVRIGLKKYPFVRQGTYAKDMVRTTGYSLTPESADFTDTFLDLSQLVKCRCYSPQAWSGDILVQVNYTDDKTQLEPQMVYKEGETTTLALGLLGKHKNTHWSFQKEWRYLMSFIPFNYVGNPVDIEKKAIENMKKMILGQLPAPFECFDLNIEASAFESMVITPSPQISAGNMVILDALIKEFNPTAKIQESTLIGLI